MKISDFCLKQGQGIRGRAAPPTQGYIEYPPPPRGGVQHVYCAFLIIE